MKVVPESSAHHPPITRDTYPSVMPEVSEAAAEAAVALVPRAEETAEVNQPVAHAVD